VASASVDGIIRPSQICDDVGINQPDVKHHGEAPHFIRAATIACASDVTFSTAKRASRRGRWNRFPLRAIRSAPMKTHLLCDSITERCCELLISESSTGASEDGNEHKHKPEQRNFLRQLLVKLFSLDVDQLQLTAHSPASIGTGESSTVHTS
jgi:hypothetical protein